MASYKKILLTVIVILGVFFCCATLKDYKRPTIQHFGYKFSYTILAPKSEKSINSSIVVTSTELSKDINLNYENTEEEAKTINKSEIARRSVQRYQGGLENIEVGRINREFKESLESDLVEILKNKGVTNPFQRNYDMYNLPLQDRKKASMIIIPVVKLGVNMERPAQKSEFVGWSKDRYDKNLVIIREQLTSEVNLNMNIKIFEPLTEKLLYESPQKTIEGISSTEMSFFVDSAWGKAEAKLLSAFTNYVQIEFTDYSNVYSKSISEIYSKLLDNIYSAIDSEMLEELNSNAKSVREQVIPVVSDLKYSFDFKYPTKYQKSVNVSAAFLTSKPEEEQQESADVQIAEIYTDFKSSLSKQLNELFEVRGIKIFGEYKSIDDMVYMEKKEAYFVLSIDKDYSISQTNLITQNIDPLIVQTSDVNFKGNFTLTMIEPMSKQKLLNRKINVEETIKDVKKVVYSRNSEVVVLADTNPEKIAQLLDKAYQKIMQNLWDLLSPNSIKKIKSNVNEIRERLGFPALP